MASLQKSCLLGGSRYLGIVVFIQDSRIDPHVESLMMTANVFETYLGSAVREPVPASSQIPTESPKTKRNFTRIAKLGAWADSSKNSYQSSMFISVSHFGFSVPQRNQIANRNAPWSIRNGQVEFRCQPLPFFCYNILSKLKNLSSRISS